MQYEQDVDSLSLRSDRDSVSRGEDDLCGFRNAKGHVSWSGQGGRGERERRTSLIETPLVGFPVGPPFR